MIRYSDNSKFKFTQSEEYVFLRFFFTSHFVSLANIPLYELILFRKISRKSSIFELIQNCKTFIASNAICEQEISYFLLKHALWLTMLIPLKYFGRLWFLSIKLLKLSYCRRKYQWWFTRSQPSKCIRNWN